MKKKTSTLKRIRRIFSGLSLACLYVLCVFAVISLAAALCFVPLTWYGKKIMAQGEFIILCQSGLMLK